MTAMRPAQRERRLVHHADSIAHCDVAALADIVTYTDDYLRVSEVADWPNALNGLQIENSGSVAKIGAAVDISTRVLAAAIERQVELLLVHHGLFWPGLQPITGALFRQLKMAFDHNVALYSAHLPLDLHPIVGNNIQLATSIGLEGTEPFLEMKGAPIGVKAHAVMPRDQLAARLRDSLGGPVQTFMHGPMETSTIGVVTGGAGAEIYAAARAGVDIFVTGEAPHWAAVAAEELAVNLLVGGHYRTETFGVKAMAAHLSERFQIPWEFIDCPTGL